MRYKLDYKRYSENSILITWPSKIDENILRDIIFYKKKIENYYVKEIVEVIFSYNSLLIYYVSTIEDTYSVFFELKTLYSSPGATIKTKNRCWKIPVCYAPSLAPDLESFAQEKSLTIEEVIAIHTAPKYRVFFLGFLPGFFYLGGLDKRLFFGRKNTPSLKVKRGSVAIGGNQTGIYPTDSPGGWHVIGKCPVSFFDSNNDPPCYISPNDRIHFISIDEHQYNDISLRFSNNDYHLDFDLV